jgi:hypothetical protein
MNVEECRAEMEACVVASMREGQKFKEMNIVYVRLEELYQRFDERERTIADEVVNQWLTFGDENHWRLAVRLAHVFRLHSALPSLRTLLSRLRRKSGPGAPFDAGRVARLISKLSGEK